MKKIYILLMHTNTIPAKIIRFVTKYEYSHVCLSLDKKCDVIYSFGRKKLNNFFNSGFNIEHKNGDFFHKFNKTTCRIYEIKISNIKYHKIKKIITEMVNNQDIYKYDFWGLILRYLGIPITIKNRYVCSYFVADILKKTDVYDFNKRVCFIKPKDFANLKKATEIYHGSYILYNLSQNKIL